MAGTYRNLGVVKAQFDFLDTDGNRNGTSIVSCGLTAVSKQTILTDAVQIRDASGIPGQFCTNFDVPATIEYEDVRLDTCAQFSNELDAALSAATDLMTLAGGDVIGVKNRERSASSLCDTTVNSRIGVTTWSFNFCPDGTVHPDGKYIIRAFPAVDFRPSGEDDVVNADTAATGPVYIGRMYANSNFGRGPGDIIPAEEITAGLDRDFYKFASDVEPPGGCGACTGCGEAPPTPLAGVAPGNAAPLQAGNAKAKEPAAA